MPQALSKPGHRWWAPLSGALLLAAATAAGAGEVPPAQDAAAAATAPQPVPSFALKLPQEQPVVFRGMVSHDGAGVQGGQMLYPAPNAGGLLVAILTHGLLVEAQKNSQRSQLQQAADQVLAPYKDALDAFSHADLARLGAAQAALIGPHRYLPPDGVDAAAWVVESAPVFVLAQDQSALVLENTLAIYPRDEPGKPLFQGVVKVVSDPQDAAASSDYWGADQAARLRDESTRLFAHSLGLALAQARRPSAADGPQKTHRFAEGRSERMERGTLLSRECNRSIIKNLRGWLLSIPDRPAATADTAPCTNPLRPA